MQPLSALKFVRLPASRWNVPSAIVVALLTLTGCCSTSPIAYQGLSSVSQLQPTEDDEKPFQYHGMSVDLRNYTKLIVDPVTIYSGSDAQFGSVSQEDRQIIADYMRQKFTERLGKKYMIVQAPEPGTVKLHLTLTGIEKSTIVLSTITHVAPFGLIANGGFQAFDHNGTFFGSVSYAVELSDASTNDLLYAYVTKQTPDALDVTASIGYLDAAKTGVRIGATHLQDDLAKPGTDITQ